MVYVLAVHNIFQSGVSVFIGLSFGRKTSFCMHGSQEVSHGSTYKPVRRRFLLHAAFLVYLCASYYVTPQ